MANLPESMEEVKNVLSEYMYQVTSNIWVTGSHVLIEQKN